MSSVIRAALVVDALLAAIALLGLMVRGHWRAAWMLCAYLVSLIGFEAWWAVSERGPTPEAWVLGACLHGLLVLLLALEMAVRLFVRLPRARLRVGVALAGALVVFAVSLAGIERLDTLTVATMVIPRLTYLRAASFVVVAVAALWYMVPIYWIHRALLLGLVPYLLLFTLVQALQRSLGWGSTPALSAVNVGGFLCLLAWLAWACWRPVERLEGTAVGFLQPWRPA